jgi:hypothetical protein
VGRKLSSSLLTGKKKLIQLLVAKKCLAKALVQMYHPVWKLVVGSWNLAAATLRRLLRGRYTGK